ncbi:MAG: aldehyde dehydrogenase family protein [Pseudohongiellaceae bacterium]
MQKHYINGTWQESAGAKFVSVNPATDAVLWQGKEATAAEVDAAVQAARDAFVSWRGLSFAERQGFVARFIEEVKRNEQVLAQAIHEETGKPLWESATEIGTMVGKAAVSEQAHQQRTGVSDNENSGLHNQLTHRPIGVFVVLGPYNFPGHLPNGHIIPALLAGNTVVFKPSELTPRFGELMVQCWIEAGLPAGVVNLVQGGGKVGELLVAAPNIDGLLFTGSSRTGHAIHKAFAGQPEKMLALEMGGNNPLVVEQVADIDAAVYTIIQSAFISSGQRCTCARRLLLLRNPGNEKLVERLVEVTKAIRVGSDDECFIGPLVSNRAADQVMAFADALLARGATALLAPRRADSKLPFIHPGILDVSSLIAGNSGAKTSGSSKRDKTKIGAKGLNELDEECFGPLLQLYWVDDMEAAIEAANATRYGLAAGLLSDNEAAWQQFAAHIRAGIVNFNRPTTGASGAAPFGGVGASGNYRPGAFYAADYCAYPMASVIGERVSLPAKPSPGIVL